MNKTNAIEMNETPNVCDAASLKVASEQRKKP